MSNRMTYEVGNLTFIKDKTHVDEAFVWASLEDDDAILVTLNPGEPILILSVIQYDPVSQPTDGEQRVPTLYRALTRGGIGWVNVFNLLPCSSNGKKVL